MRLFKNWSVCFILLFLVHIVVIWLTTLPPRRRCVLRLPKCLFIIWRWWVAWWVACFRDFSRCRFVRRVACCSFLAGTVFVARLLRFEDVVVAFSGRDCIFCPVPNSDFWQRLSTFRKCFVVFSRMFLQNVHCWKNCSLFFQISSNFVVSSINFDEIYSNFTTNYRFCWNLYKIIPRICEMFWNLTGCEGTYGLFRPASP